VSGLGDLKRCPKCKSADIRGPYPKVARVAFPYECIPCGNKFNDPFVLGDQPKPPTEFRPAEALEANADEPLNLTIATAGDVIKFDLGRRVAWFALPKAQAIEFAIATLRHAGVNVDVKHRIEGQGGG